MKSERETKSRERLERLCEVMRGKRAMLIVLQDFPDPDAIAAAAALKELARVMADLSVSVACSGVVGRSENRALVRYMDINMLRMKKVDTDQFDLIAMVDTQPTTGNNDLSPEILPQIVIDHHPINNTTRRCEFHDIRKHYGATATILYEYLTTAGIPPSTQLATALVYGIRSDTDDLGREISQYDVDAFVDLYPSVNHRIMGRMKMASLPDEYYVMLHTALEAARRYGSSIVADIGVIENPDMIGEVADLLLRGENCEWTLCFGCFEGRLLLSVRTAATDGDAGQVVTKLVAQKGTGGGHGAMAGGQINVDSATQTEMRSLEKMLLTRFLKQTGNEGERCARLVKASG